MWRPGSDLAGRMFGMKVRELHTRREKHLQTAYQANTVIWVEATREYRIDLLQARVEIISPLEARFGLQDPQEVCTMPRNKPWRYILVPPATTHAFMLGDDRIRHLNKVAHIKWFIRRSQVKPKVEDTIHLNRCYLAGPHVHVSIHLHRVGRYNNRL